MKVVELYHNNAWSWPKGSRTNVFYAIQNQIPPNLSNDKDVVKWKDSSGNLLHFSTTKAWLCLNDNGDDESWSKIVWCKADRFMTLTSTFSSNAPIMKKIGIQ